MGDIKKFSVLACPVVLLPKHILKQHKYKYNNKTHSGVFRKSKTETPLVVQWLRLRAPNARGLGLIPFQGIESHMLPLRIFSL